MQSVHLKLSWYKFFKTFLVESDKFSRNRSTSLKRKIQPS